MIEMGEEVIIYFSSKKPTSFNLTVVDLLPINNLNCSNARDLFEGVNTPTVSFKTENATTSVVSTLPDCQQEGKDLPNVVEFFF